jgi:hypothetical protein
LNVDDYAWKASKIRLAETVTVDDIKVEVSDTTEITGK